MIYIINQEIEFNEEPVTISFFKDITFGILYEQIMAQDELQKIITNNLDQKIGQKLKKISENVIDLSRDKSLQKFEQDYPNPVGISKQLDIMGILSRMMLYSIGDVKDWQALKQGRFANNKHAFNLDEALNEINDIVNFHLKSHNKTITLILEAHF